MRTQYSIAIAMLVACGCQEQGDTGGPVSAQVQRSSVVDASDPDILELSNHSIPLEKTIAILEADYLVKIASNSFAAADEESRDALLAFASQANAPSALGVVGQRKESPTLDGMRIIVLHNARLVGDAWQATSFSILSGKLFGTVKWGLVSPQLHFSAPADDPADQSCARPFRGCSVLTATDMRPHAFSNWEAGGLGFSPQTRLDAESAALPQNQTGRTIELWDIPNPDVAKILWPPLEGFAGNRYACAGPMTEALSAGCDKESSGDPLPAVLYNPNSETPLGPSVVIISEADFQNALLRGELANLNPQKNRNRTAKGVWSSAIVRV